MAGQIDKEALEGKSEQANIFSREKEAAADMKDLKERFIRYFNEHEAEMIEDVKTLCRINSVKGAYEAGKPFGEGPYNALMTAMAMCERYGMRTVNYDDYVIAADLSDRERQLDILAHMDVVAPGEGWTVTEPFDPVVKDGRIYGRGTSDDKGPAIAALYAMRAVKELDIPVSRSCRLILGSDEECGMSDVKHYYAVENEAPMTFSPDSEFPVTNVEKGQFRMDISASFDEEEGESVLLELKGGTTINIVPGRAYAVVKGLDDDLIRAEAGKVCERTGVSFSISATPEGLRIDAEGQSAHAAHPDDGRNAALALLELVNALPLTECTQTRLLKKLSRLFPYGDNKGFALSMAVEDELSGPTTVSADILEADRTHISLKADSRTSVAADEENTVKPAERSITEAGFELSYSVKGSHVVDGDSDFIRTLLKCYEEVKGVKGHLVSTGGSTYVHDLKNGVAFGAVGEFTETNMHGPDEFMVIEELKEAAVIYALSISELCR